jgi:hypothetical protein
MDEQRAQRVVDQLREHGVDARMEKAGVYEFGVRVRLPGGREAIWDSDGAAGLEAQVMLDGMLVGFVPVIPGSDSYDDAQVAAAIATTDYDAPVDLAPRTAPAPPPPLPAAEQPLTRDGGVFRRFLGGFRERPEDPQNPGV